MRAWQFQPGPPPERCGRAVIRRILSDRLHYPTRQPFRPSPAEPHRSRAVRLFSPASVALAEDLLDLLSVDRLLLGDHSGRWPRLRRLSFCVPQPPAPGPPGEMVG